MPVVELSDQEWNQVITILSAAPWRDANPLLVKISTQLQPQTRTPTGAPARGNSSKEYGHE